MPSIITHAVTALAAGKIASNRKLPVKFWVASILCSILPDIDAFFYKFGINYHNPFYHRGFFHSLSFAFLVSLIVVLVFFRKEKLFSKKIYLFLYFGIVTASHGILDSFTSGGQGIAFFSPFDNTRFFAPVTPITVSPLMIGAFFSWWGIEVLLSEMLLVWIPLGFVLMLVRMYRKQKLSG